MQKSKRGARELALNVLYQIDVAGMRVDEALQMAFDHIRLTPSAQEYARSLVMGTLANLWEIDKKLRSVSTEWPPRRQSFVDRNILRIAVFEMDYVRSVPDVVAIDEGIELAKKFGSAESGKFINGVLAAYLREFVHGGGESA